MIKKLLFIMVIVSFFACEKDDNENGEKSLVGTWDITSMTIWDANIPGDGSYLTFNECGDTECTGVDFEATDGTSGTFTYELSDDESTLTIDDDSAEGGGYNGTWSVTTFTSSNLTIMQTSLLGGMTINLRKR